MRERHGNVQETLTTANAERVYKVTRADLPLHCPLPSMYLWNSHPKVYLADRGHRRSEMPLLQLDVPLDRGRSSITGSAQP